MPPPDAFALQWSAHPMHLKCQKHSCPMHCNTRLGISPLPCKMVIPKLSPISPEPCSTASAVHGLNSNKMKQMSVFNLPAGAILASCTAPWHAQANKHATQPAICLAKPAPPGPAIPTSACSGSALHVSLSCRGAQAARGAGAAGGCHWGSHAEGAGGPGAGQEVAVG